MSAGRTATRGIDVAIVVDEAYAGDRLFDASSPLNRDDCLAPFRLLRRRVAEAGGRLHTADVFARLGSVPAVALFLDVPARPVAEVLDPWHGRTRPWVVLQESEVVLPRNWDLARHGEFDRLFTWRDPFVDGHRYLKLDFADVLTVPEPLDIDRAERNLCTMIAGNKTSPHPLELYSRRIEAICFFEREHPDEFALYGTGWDVAQSFPSYGGRVAEKREVLGRYWFSICFENAHGIPGYVTDKLFDCLLARTVPVYWGPDEIERHVDPACFVDMRRFASYRALYEHLTTMEPGAYAAHLEAARRFLAGGRARRFTAEHYADVLVGELARAAGAPAAARAA